MNPCDIYVLFSDEAFDIEIGVGYTKLIFENCTQAEVVRAMSLMRKAVLKNGYIKDERPKFVIHLHEAEEAVVESGGDNE